MVVQTLSISELLTFREVAGTNQKIIAIADRLNLHDLEINNPKKLVATNTLTFVDNYKYHYGIKIGTFNDSLVFKDASHRAAAVHIIEFLHLVEVARTVLGSDISETLNFVESVIANAGPIIQDTIRFLESIGLKHNRHLSVNENISFKDFAVYYEADPYYYAIPRDVLIPPF